MSKTRRSAFAASTATAAVALAKTIIGAERVATMTEKLPQAVSEIHVGPNEVIPAGTTITEEVAAEAGLDEDDVLDLIDRGHAKLVDVLTRATAPAPTEG